MALRRNTELSNETQQFLESLALPEVEVAKPKALLSLDSCQPPYHLAPPHYLPHMGLALGFVLSAQQHWPMSHPPTSSSRVQGLVIPPLQASSSITFPYGHLDLVSVILWPDREIP